MSEGKISLLPYVQRIKQASNKEAEITRILNELDAEYSLTKDQKIGIIGAFENYFQREDLRRQQSRTESYVPCKTRFDLDYIFRATDNSEILDALKHIKQFL